MQDIFVEKPYQFVPPIRVDWVPWIIRRWGLFRPTLRKQEGVVGFECRHAERLKDSIRAGHSVLITPNHCRTADPLVMGWLANEADCLFYAMASWHLFNQGWFQRLAIRAMGGFSVYREGIDRQAVSTAVDALEAAQRPLVIFPEGTATRTNDRLSVLLDGVGFIARTAAKRLAKQGQRKVVVHPVALKYRFHGDLDQAVLPVVESIERRLLWQPQSELTLVDRITKIGSALLSLKELEFFGQVQGGTLAQRQQKLIDRLLVPLEEEWLSSAQDGGVVSRVKSIRMKLWPEMAEGSIDQAEMERRWRQIADTYLAQQVACYPEDYLQQFPSVDRILETIERFEEDLTDRARVHGNLQVIIDVGEPIEVSPKRDRNAEIDPLMAELRTRLQAQLDELACESPLYRPPVEKSL